MLGRWLKAEHSLSLTRTDDTPSHVSQLHHSDIPTSTFLQKAQYFPISHCNKTDLSFSLLL